MFTQARADAGRPEAVRRTLRLLETEPYYLLEEEGYKFGFPPSLEDYRALLACSVRSLNSPPLLPGAVFDRTPLDYLAYMAATGADPCDEADAAALRPAFVSLDLLVITLITQETERVLPAAEMPGLRSQMNDALLELVYDDPLDAWAEIPVLELTGPLDGRLDTGLAALTGVPSVRIVATCWPAPGGGVRQLCRPAGHALIGRELYLPKSWIGDQARCAAARWWILPGVTTRPAGSSSRSSLP